METHKSRGLKHIQDKRKYKGNTIKNPKYIPSSTRPVLDSNEDRYLEESTAASQTFQLSSSTNFAILSETPISRGHHFQFKSDKLIAEEVEAKSRDLFSIDVEAIHNSILTVPFYERIGIGDSYFSESENKYMKSEAIEHMKRISEKTKGSVVKNIKYKESKERESSIAEENNIQDDITGYVPTDCTGKTMNEDKKTVPDNELEEWLENILDD